jgi:hypothetical protein
VSVIPNTIHSVSSLHSRSGGILMASVPGCSATRR